MQLKLLSAKKDKYNYKILSVNQKISVKDKQRKQSNHSNEENNEQKGKQ
jgi:hypothetical protein